MEKCIVTRPKHARVFKSKTKVMVITIFDVHGIVHVEFLLQGQAISQNFYKNILQQLMCSVRDKKRTVKNEVMAASS